MDRLPKGECLACLIAGGRGVALSALFGFVFNAGPLFGVPWLKSLLRCIRLRVLLTACADWRAGCRGRNGSRCYSLFEQAYREGANEVGCWWG